MKKIVLILSAIIFIFTACEKDNYDAPNIMLTGRMVHNGEAVGLKHGEVTFRIYEPGWELSSSTYVNVSVSQEGTFSANLFGGKTYKLIRVANMGPWVNPTSSDTITVTSKGDTQVDIPVEPFFTIPSSQITIDGGVAEATFSINQNISTATLEYAGLYVASNRLVDANNNQAQVTINEADITDMNNISLSVPLNDKMKNEGYVFARVGVKTAGYGQMLYSQAVRVDVR